MTAIICYRYKFFLSNQPIPSPLKLLIIKSHLPPAPSDQAKHWRSVSVMCKMLKPLQSGWLILE